MFGVLAALLAVLLITSIGNDESSVADQQVSTLADMAEPAAAAEVPTTAPLEVPTPAPTATPWPTAEPQPTATPAPTPEPTPEEAAATASAASESSNETTTTTNSAPATNTAPEATTAANPQPQATTAANPQPQATTAANPQLPAGSEGTVTAPAPAPAGGTFTRTLTATVSRPTLYNAAGGSPFTPTFNGTALPAVNPTVFGNPLVYRVLAGEPGDQWAQVYVPARPNGTRAWVKTSEFSWGQSNRKLVINTSNNTVTVYEGSNVLITTDAVLGKSSSRTPRANGWVEEIMAGPSSAYGPRLISLGIFSDDLNSFGGSIPKIALHGTNNPSLMGQYASNGCIRVRNEIITQIANMLPTGSRVEII